MHGVRQNVRDLIALRGRPFGLPSTRKCSQYIFSPRMQKEDGLEIRMMVFHAGVFHV
jgi:hypothetical protein